MHILLNSIFIELIVFAVLERNQQMPKQKTHKGLAKRVKVTGRGKVKRMKAGAGHLMSSKSSKRRRNLRVSTLVKGLIAKVTKSQLGA